MTDEPRTTAEWRRQYAEENIQISNRLMPRAIAIAQREKAP